MATYNLDGDQPFETCTIGGVEFVFGDVLNATEKERIKGKIKNMGPNTKDEWIKILLHIVGLTNDNTYFDEAKVTDAELVQFAVLVGRIVGG